MYKILMYRMNKHFTLFIIISMCSCDIRCLMNLYVQSCVYSNLQSPKFKYRAKLIVYSF